jgi:N-acylneuraminate cytidylyltransferase
MVAIIPARSGSQRIPGKNVKELAGHPLMAYTIQAALQSGCFENIILSTDSPDIARIGQKYGAKVPFLRPVEWADGAHTFEWLKWTVDQLPGDEFAILYPTNPFRTVETIKRAVAAFVLPYTSLISMSPVREHPEKAWYSMKMGDNTALPMAIPYIGQMITLLTPGRKVYNMPIQGLWPCLAQHANIRITRRVTIEHYQNETGAIICPFVVDFPEAFDINSPEDWLFAEFMIEKGIGRLPTV